MAEEKICFIISPIGSDDSEAYYHFKKVKRHLIDYVANKKGYKTIRADDISEPGKITRQIIDYLRKSKLVIADITDKNPNVFYELAIRDAVRLPVILIRDRERDRTSIPFDITTQRFFEYSIDLDYLEISRNKLEDVFDSVEKPDFLMDSPVTDTLIRVSDAINVTTENTLQLILDKLSNLSISSVLQETPSMERFFTEIRKHEKELTFIYGMPEKLLENAKGQAVSYDILLDFYKINLEKGINQIYYDKDSYGHWLWLYNDKSRFYFSGKPTGRLL